MKINEAERNGVILAAAYSLGILLPGEILPKSDLWFFERALDGLLATLHLELAKQVALCYKVPLATPIIATENEVAPPREQKPNSD